MSLKTCFIDITHWHAPLYYSTLQETVGVAALTARNPQTGRDVAARLGSRFYADWRDMLRQERPDFVFASGRHRDMAETARFHAGPVSRYYDNDNAWNLKRDEAGGGCLINVGIHLPDLYLHLTGKQPRSVYAVTRNQVWGEEVEDFAQVLVEMQDRALCVIECAYVHATTPRAPSIEFSLHSKRHQFRSLGEDNMLWVDREGRHHDLPGPQANTAFYPAFVVDTVDAVQSGRAPIAGIEDNLAALRIVDAAYRSAAQGKVVQLS